MAAIFLDTSALVRRYDRSEPGASRVRAICAPAGGHTLLLARFASVEVASALARKARDGTLSTTDRTRLWRLFRVHWRDQYQVVAMTEDVYAHAERLVFRSPLRGLDALHLGCALVVAARLPQIGLEFWTADKCQAQAARTEGFTVELVT
jgi:predicted nucleic acid-binding protein